MSQDFALSQNYEWDESPFDVPEHLPQCHVNIVEKDVAATAATAESSKVMCKTRTLKTDVTNKISEEEKKDNKTTETTRMDAIIECEPECNVADEPVTGKVQHARANVIGEHTVLEKKDIVITETRRIDMVTLCESKRKATSDPAEACDEKRLKLDESASDDNAVSTKPLVLDEGSLITIINKYKDGATVRLLAEPNCEISLGKNANTFYLRKRHGKV